MFWRKRIEKRLSAVEKMAACRHEDTRLSVGSVPLRVPMQPYFGQSIFVSQMREVCTWCGKVVRVFKSDEEFLHEQLLRKQEEIVDLRKQLDEAYEEESDADQD